MVNGVAQQANQEIDLTSTQLLQTVYQFGSAPDQVEFRSNDGLQWGAWTTSTVSPGVETPPTVVVSNLTAAHGQSFPASALLAVSVVSGEAVAAYGFFNTGAGGGRFVLNGVTQPINHDIDVTAAQLSQLAYQSGSGADILWVRASDGTQWSAWSSSFTVTAPITRLPSLTMTSDGTASRGQTVALSTLVTIADPDQVGFSKLELYDTNGTAAGGQFVINGVVQTGGHVIDVALADVANAVFDAGTLGGTDMLYAQLLQSNGQVSGWKQFTVNAPVDTGPVVGPISNVTTVPAQIFAPLRLFMASDPFGDAITQYDFWNTGAGGARFVVNDSVLRTNQENIITAAQAGQLVYQSGSGADTLAVRVGEGGQWSPWSNNFTVTGVNAATIAAGSTHHG